MSEVFSDFIRALRAADIRISPSEAIDARTAFALLGFENRAFLRDGLGQTLAKSTLEKQIFDETFDRYFAFRVFTAPDDAAMGAQSLKSPEQKLNETADDPAGHAAGSGGGQGGGDGTGQGSGQDSGQNSRQDSRQDSSHGEASIGEDLIRLLEQDDRAALQQRLAQAARQTGLNNIRFFTQRGGYALRILHEMGGETLDDAILEGRNSADAINSARAERLALAREKLRAQIRDYVEKQLALFAASAGRKLREEILSVQRLSAIERGDMALMQALLRKMAKRVAALHSRRRHKARRGQLDMRRTIRANNGLDGLMFHTIWKQRRIDRPKVMALCDVSGSVAQVSRFLLLFLHQLHEVIPAVRSFAFASSLGEVTDLFAQGKPEIAIAQTLQRFGGSTDYGAAFVHFSALALNEVDRRTTVLVLGDARNNGGEPRADILRKIHDRAHRVIFLNPEPRISWNTGDSVMRAYEPCCDRALVCASLKDLERVIADILRMAA